MCVRGCVLKYDIIHSLNKNSICYSRYDNLFYSKEISRSIGHR